MCVMMVVLFMFGVDVADFVMSMLMSMLVMVVFDAFVSLFHG